MYTISTFRDTLFGTTPSSVRSLMTFLSIYPSCMSCIFSRWVHVCMLIPLHACLIPMNPSLHIASDQEMIASMGFQSPMILGKKTGGKSGLEIAGCRWPKYSQHITIGGWKITWQGKYIVLGCWLLISTYSPFCKCLPMLILYFEPWKSILIIMWSLPLAGICFAGSQKPTSHLSGY